ncbi:MAG: hypothetical protein AB8B53_04485 [Flavobacteriales bacterium]
MKEQFRTEKELQSEAPEAGHRNRFIEKLSAREESKNSEPPKSKVRWMPWLGGLAAAAVALWAVFTLVIAGPSELPITASKEKFNPIEAMSERNFELEGIFTQHIQPKIPGILEQNPDLKDQVDLLDRLDREYVKLKALFIQTKGSETVTKEMIRNHKLRLKIMELMLNQLELMKTKKIQKNEIKSA